MNRSFDNELDYIDSEIMREFVGYCLSKAPDYFYTMPASTTGKYHPAYTLGEGGLVRHTKAAVRIAHELLRLEQYGLMPCDQIISALILHDVIKKGNNKSEYTVTEHPVLAYKFVNACLLEVADEYENRYGIPLYKLFEIEVAEMCNLILSHMGQWNTDRMGRELMPKPCSEAAKFVHLCDYLASRKFITCEVD